MAAHDHARRPPGRGRGGVRSPAGLHRRGGDRSSRRVSVVARGRHGLGHAAVARRRRRRQRARERADGAASGEERLLQRVGLDPEGRKFTPHVTLARLRDSSSWQVADYLANYQPYRSSAFPVSRFVLYSARSSAGGGPYIVEDAYPLAA
ncbi:MAG: hypothetical protein H7Z43_15475 [Clostridia bacterium]|nr:hypothetical protein [Deltaproteobacteria bacterium]